MSVTKIQVEVQLEISDLSISGRYAFENENFLIINEEKHFYYLTAITITFWYISFQSFFCAQVCFVLNFNESILYI